MSHEGFVKLRGMTGSNTILNQPLRAARIVYPRKVKKLSESSLINDIQGAAIAAAISKL